VQILPGEAVVLDVEFACPQPLGACCDGAGNCTRENETACVDGGGFYQGDDTTCEAGDTCGACCVGDVCSDTIDANCHGVFQGPGTDCDPNPCLSATGVCCDGAGGCVEMPESLCSGIFGGEGTDCDDLPDEITNTLRLAESGEDVIFYWAPAAAAIEYSVRHGYEPTLLDLDLPGAELGRSTSPDTFFTAAGEMAEGSPVKYYQVRGENCDGVLGQ
jgi:hypothetical protein